MPAQANRVGVCATGWHAGLAKLTMGWLVLETLTGLALTFGPFHATVQWGLLVHTLAGVALLAPICWYWVAHWLDYEDQALSDVVLIGYAGAAALLVCCVSGVVVTVEALFGIHTSEVWRNVHLVS